MATKKEIQSELDALGAEYGSKDTVAELEEKLAAAKAAAAATQEGPEAEQRDEADADDITSEWRVLGGFNDRHTGEYHAPGDVIAVTDERAAEILSVDRLIERA